MTTKRLNKAVKQKRKIRPIRRLSQTAIICLLIAVPLISQNPNIWSPSLIVQGYFPPASISLISGDTWSFAIGNFQILHPAAFLDVLCASKVLTLSLFVSALIPLCMTLFFGRVFCSWLCPIGFILELTTKIRRFIKKRVALPSVSLGDFRYIILVAALVAGCVLACPVISIFDAPHILGRELILLFTHQQLSTFGVTFLIVIVLFELFFVSRAWCRYVCPSGGCLSLLGTNRLLQVRVDQSKCNTCETCQNVCPYGLAPNRPELYRKIDWAVCDNCGLCMDVCPTEAISFQFKIKIKTLLFEKT